MAEHPRTVGELIVLLQQYPPEMRVVTPGFDEYRLEDLGVPVLRWVVFDDGPMGSGHAAARHVDVTRDVEGQRLMAGPAPQRAVLLTFWFGTEEE